MRCVIAWLLAPSCVRALTLPSALCRQGAGLAGVSRTVPIITHISLEHGYLSCTVNETHLLISSRRSDDGTSMDEVVLVKPQH